MAEAIAATASVVAIIQITESVIRSCKSYIENVKGYPSDLRRILVEASMLKTVFESLSFLDACNSSEVSNIVAKLSGENGPIEGCRRSITALETLLSSESPHANNQTPSKRQKVQVTLAALAWPLKETKAKKLLDEVVQYKETITLALTTETFEHIKEVKQKASEMHDMLTDNQRQEVYRWLHHTDPSPQHHKAQKDYESGTGNWVLRSPEWKRWLEREQRALWIHGIPGAGKTVLMSYLIEQVEQHCEESQEKIAHVYYYCYFGRNQDEAVPFLRWLLNQLCRKAKMVPSKLRVMFEYGGEPSLVQLLSALADMMNDFVAIYVIIDALDESFPRDDILMVLRDMLTFSRFEKLQLLASSREYKDIENTMDNLSVSVSMSNPYVEEDIRLYVRSTLQSNPKFRRWPQDLLNETENGCQGNIDALQRLRSERDTVKRALENLPKTLDETYDRIFLSIPEEERLFVHHALQWMCYHQELYDGQSIPCAILLQAVEKSIAKFTGNEIELHYDNETIRELCGCLVRITQERQLGREGIVLNTRLVVTFAHYTVREYLDSTRNLNASHFLTTWKTDLKLNLLEMIYVEAHHVKLNHPWDQDAELITDVAAAEALDEDFNSYCVVSTLLSMRQWPAEIAEQDELYYLAMELLNPSRSNYETFILLAFVIDSNSEMFPDRGWWYEGYFWEVAWDPEPENSTAAHFLNILFMADGDGFGALVLASKFLQSRSPKDFFQQPLRFQGWGGDYVKDDTTSGRYMIRGPMVEVFAQLAFKKTREFLFLLNHGSGCFDVSKALALSMSAHHHDDYYEGEEEGHGNCFVKILLDLGADANANTYQLTPLQIAVACWDVEGVSMLLEAGAHPNDTGNSEGVFWEKGTLMGRFNYLRNCSPLYICKRLEGFLEGNERAHGREENWLQIEQILLQYGAEEFVGTSLCHDDAARVEGIDGEEYVSSLNPLVLSDC